VISASLSLKNVNRSESSSRRTRAEKAEREQRKMAKEEEQKKKKALPPEKKALVLLRRQREGHGISHQELITNMAKRGAINSHHMLLNYQG